MHRIQNVLKVCLRNPTKLKFNKIARTCCEQVRQDEVRNYNTYSCWNCGFAHDKMRIVCSSCQVIQNQYDDIEMIDYFEIFKLQSHQVIHREKQFDQDVEQIKQIYRKLQMIFHPDRIANQLASQYHKEDYMLQQQSQKYSSIVNKAYETLKDSYKRTVYLLKLKGVYIGDQHKDQDMEFLQQIMEIRMEVEETDDHDELVDIQIDCRNKIRQILKTIQTNFYDNFDEQQMIQWLSQIKYYRSIIDAILNKIEDQN